MLWKQEEFMKSGKSRKIPDRRTFQSVNRRLRENWTFQVSRSWCFLLLFSANDNLCATNAIENQAKFASLRSFGQNCIGRRNNLRDSRKGTSEKSTLNV